MDVEENEISIILKFLDNLSAILTILEQTKLSLFIKISISKISLLIFYQVSTRGA